MDAEPPNPDSDFTVPEPVDPPPVVDYLTPQPPTRTLKLMRFPSVVEASLARLALDARGIQVEIAGQAGPSDLGVYGAATRGLELLVDESQFDQAKGILDAIDARRAARQAAAEARLKCPVCGTAKSSAFDRRYLRVAIVLFIVAGVLWAMTWIPGPSASLRDDAKLAFIPIAIVGVVALAGGTGKRTCRQCGNIWSPPEDEEDDGDDDEPDSEQESPSAD